MSAALALARLVAKGKRHHLAPLRELSPAPRWRVREPVAMALRWSEDDFPG